MPAPIDTTYCHVQGLSRGLYILRTLNDMGQGATPRDISAITKINRSTVKRILESLVDDGYVLPCDEGGGYSLSPQVLGLSRGLTKDAWLLQCAGPVLKSISQDTGWSMRVTAPRDDAMVICESTHSRSKLASEATVGIRHHLPILLTAAGRAYFAQCDVKERGRILQRIRARKDEQSAVASNDRLVELLTRRVLDDGYALNDGEWGGRGTGAIAVPVRNHDGQPLASLSVVYSRGAFNRSAVISELFPELRRGADRVEAALRSS